MSSLIFFIAAFILFLVAAFWFANSENKQASEAERKADQALSHIKAMDSSLATLKSDVQNQLTIRDEKSLSELKRLTNLISQGLSDQQKFKERTEWVEMKLQNQHRPSPPTKTETKVTLTQEKPLQINVLYREAKAPPKQIEDKTRAAIVEKVKKQVRELSQ